MIGKWNGAGTNFSEEDRILSKKLGFNVYVEFLSYGNKNNLIKSFEGDGVQAFIPNGGNIIADGATYLDRKTGKMYKCVKQADDMIVLEQTPPAPPFEAIDVSSTAEELINHNLGRYPIVQTLLSVSGGYEQIEAMVLHQDENNVKVSFNEPFTGKIILTYT